IASPLAMRTPFGAMPLLRFFATQCEATPFGRLRCIQLGSGGRLPAVRTESSDQTLSLHRNDRGSRKKGLHAHINQTSKGTESVVGVQSGKHKMTGQSRLHCNFGGLQISNLTDHDHVWILPQNRPERPCDTETDITVHLHLGQVRHLNLNWALNCDDLALTVIAAVQRRIKRGRFTPPRWPGNQDDTVRT